MRPNSLRTVSANAALSVALLALDVVLFALTAVVVAGRARRQRRERRRAALTAPLRPLLLELAAGEPDGSVRALEQLLTLDERSWAALEPDVTELLLKVRGGRKASIVALLQCRGTLASARFGPVTATSWRHCADDGRPHGRPAGALRRDRNARPRLRTHQHQLPGADRAVLRRVRPASSPCPVRGAGRGGDQPADATGLRSRAGP